MSSRNILAIGTSAGGFDALRFLASQFSHDLPASVLVAIHLSSQSRSTLDAILTQSGPLIAGFAEDGERLQKSRIYIGPPERHLLLEGDTLRLGRGPRENNARPAIDPMFRSVALCCGVRAIGVVLTGTLGDGAAGLQTLKQSGGITLVQDPSDAAYPEMPTTALYRSKPDHVVGLAEMPALLEVLVRQPAGSPTPVPDGIGYEVEIAKTGRSNVSNLERIGRRSVLTCPDCQGVMWEIDEGELLRYRCHVGHAYTAELMSLALDESLTRSLASALRALDERILVANKLHEEASTNGRAKIAELWARRGRELEQEATVIRDSIRRFDDIASLWSHE